MVFAQTARKSDEQKRKQKTRKQNSATSAMCNYWNRKQKEKDNEMNLVNEGILPPNEPDDRDERREEREMAQKRDTLADIVAEMRREVGDGKDAYCGQRIIRNMDDVRVMQYCARLEAAWKREKAEIEANALAVGGIVEASRQKHVGNAAAMREALEFCLRIIGANGIRGNVFLGDIQEAHRTITAALSAPERNCDEYDCKSDAEVGFVEQTGETDANPFYWQLFANWLFDPAAKRKGEGDAI